MSGYAPGTIRVWDGAAWRYAVEEWEEPLFESIKLGAVSTKTSTTTSCSRSPNTIHAGEKVTITGSTTGRNGGTLTFYRRFGNAGNWAKVGSRSAPAGGGNVSVTHSPTADNCQYQCRYSGSNTHKSSSSAATAGVTVQTLHSSSKTVNVGWSQAYDGSGRKISGSGRDTAVHQGYYSGTYGNRRSLLRFAPGLPANAEVRQVNFLCNGAWSHWFQNSGGTVVVGYFLDQDTQPNTWGAATTRADQSRKKADGTSFGTEVSSWANNVVGRADFSGITIGPGPSTGDEYYGYSKNAPSGNDFQLVITYTWWS